MRRPAAVAFAIAIALPACAQRGAAHPAPSFHTAPAFHSAPGFAPPFRGTAPLVRSPQVPHGYFPTARPLYLAVPGSRAPYTASGDHRRIPPPVRYPHGFVPTRPTFYHPGHGFRDRDRVVITQGFTLSPYPLVLDSGPYDWTDGDFIDQPYADQTYNNLSNDGVAPGPPAPDAGPYPEPPPGSQPEYSPESQPPTQPETQPSAPPPSPEMQYVPGSADTVTLIFKDGRPPEQIQNYLATRTTITVIQGHRRREIPVAALDLPATIKANRETGVDFQLPSAH